MHLPTIAGALSILIDQILVWLLTVYFCKVKVK